MIREVEQMHCGKNERKNEYTYTHIQAHTHTHINPNTHIQTTQADGLMNIPRSEAKISEKSAAFRMREKNAPNTKTENCYFAQVLIAFCLTILSTK